MKEFFKGTTMLLLIITMFIGMGSSAFANGEGDSVLSASYGSTYLIRDDGSLWGWGSGYTGNGDKEIVVSPIKVMENMRSVSSNAFSTIAVKNDDTLWGWGFFDSTTNGKQRVTYEVPTQILDDVLIAANGDNYVLAIRNDHTLWMSGSMVLGNGTSDQATDGFVQVMANVKSCFAGEDTVFVIKDDDTLWGWGRNWDSILGNMVDGGDSNAGVEYTPYKILEDVKSVSNSSNIVFAIRLDGSLYSWGGWFKRNLYRRWLASKCWKTN